MERPPRDVMTVLELCDYLQLSEAKVREMLRQGTLPAILIGRQWRIRKSAVDKWLAQQEQARKVIKRHGRKREIEPEAVPEEASAAVQSRLGRALQHRYQD